MNKILTLCMALALPFAIAACGDDDSTGPGDGDPTTGSFSATVSGDVSDSFDGQAFFGEGSDPDTGESGWILWLTTSETQNTGKAIYFVREGDRPGTGSHSLTDQEDEFEAGEIAAVFIDYTAAGSGGFFGSTGGSLVITDSDSDEMEGSFTIEGAGFTVSQDGELVEVDVTITGEFDAVRGDVFFPTF